MHQKTWTQMRPFPLALSRNLMLAVASFLIASPVATQLSAQSHQTPSKSHVRRASKKGPATQEVAQTPPPPPMPNWPVNDKPNPPSVVWDASGLKINASNSSLQQILSEVSTDTGTKVVGNVPDQRVFGSYGPGQASDVLLQLLQGSGYNVLLAGDLGHGAPSQIVLTPRRGGSANPSAGTNPQQQQQQMQPQDQDDSDNMDQQPEQPEQPEETVPAIPPNPQPGQPGTGPNGPIRTPQEIMQEMQQRQLMQQQQMQQQMQQQQQGNPTAPQQQENPQ